MKHLLAAILATIALTASAQSIQLHGLLMNAYSDTVRITVWSDGVLVDRQLNTYKHYALSLGERPHYTILLESGSRQKYCTVICNHMDIESIQSDVDFRSNQHVVIYQEKKSSNKYTHQIYGPGSTRILQYPKQTTE